MNVNTILNSSIKVLTIITLVIALCVSAIFIIPPVYADEVEFPEIYLQPINDVEYSFQYGSNSDASYKYKIVIYGTTTDDYIMSMFAVSGTDSGIYIVCDSTFSGVKYLRYTNNSSVGGVQNLNFLQKETYPDVYYVPVNGDTYNSSRVYTIPVFDTLEDALASFEEYLTGSSGGPVQSFERTITIKPGYVAYCYTDGGTLDLVAQFHEYSRLSRPLWDNGVRISFSGGLWPSSGATFTNSFGSAVDWLKVASAPSNILGQTMVGGRFYDAGLPTYDSGNTVVIYNPAYNNASTLVGGGTIDIGPTLTAKFSNLVEVNQFPLRADATVTYSSGASITSGSNTDYDTGYFYQASADDLSSVVTDSDYYNFDLSTNTTSPAINIVAGGSNATIDYGSGSSPEEAERGLVGLLSRILQFLASPIEHVMNLFTAGGNFMTWLGQLWVWLPSDVGALLVDALIVLIVIGVIKFLWK